MFNPDWRKRGRREREEERASEGGRDKEIGEERERESGRQKERER